MWPAVEPADAEAIALVHTEEHVTRIRNLAEAGGGWIDPDTFVGPQSYQAALFAAGATIQGIRDVISGEHQNALVLVRPPGHHARPTQGMGFCLFNNVAVAAQWSIAQGLARKVAIIDVDVHHGNGTEEIFFDRGDYRGDPFPYLPLPSLPREERNFREDSLRTRHYSRLLAQSREHSLELAIPRDILGTVERRHYPVAGAYGTH